MYNNYSHAQAKIAAYDCDDQITACTLSFEEIREKSALL